jgi:hypothetical protein
MYDLIKNICTTNNWVFTYAKKDYSNLYEGDEQVGDDTPLVFLDPVQITETFDEFNNVEDIKYEGSLMIVLSSDIDEIDYDTRYQNYIKPIIDTTLSTLKNSIKCAGDYSINNWRTIEVINALDFNVDGVIVTYSINEE